MVARSVANMKEFGYRPCSKIVHKFQFLPWKMFGWIEEHD